MRSKAHMSIEAVGSGPHITPQASKKKRKTKGKLTMRERTGESQLLVLLREKSAVCAEGRNHTHTHFRDLVIYGWVVQQVGMAAAVWR